LTVALNRRDIDLDVLVEAAIKGESHMAELANWGEFGRSPGFRLYPLSSKYEEVFAFNAVCSLGETIGNFGWIFFLPRPMRTLHSQAHGLND